MIDILLKANNLTKIYKTLTDEIVVFRNLFVELEKGKTMAIIGESGTGKTTLMNLLSGLDRPTEGEIYFEGKRIDNLDEDNISSFRNKNIGFVFQHHYLLDDCTVLENVMMPAFICGKNKSDIIDKAENLLKILGIYERKYHYPDQISGGERQRTAIARALINDPLLIFADEPTGSLDRKNAKIVEEYFWKLKDEFNLSLVIATHNLEIAKKSDKILEL